MQQAREFFFKFFHHDALLRAGIPRGALTYIRKTKKKSKKSDIGEEGKLTPPQFVRCTTLFTRDLNTNLKLLQIILLLVYYQTFSFHVPQRHGIDRCS